LADNVAWSFGTTPDHSKYTPGSWRGGSDQLPNLRFKRSSVIFILVVEQWTSAPVDQIFTLAVTEEIMGF